MFLVDKRVEVLDNLRGGDRAKDIDLLKRLVALLRVHFRSLDGLNNEQLLGRFFAHLVDAAMRASAKQLDDLKVVPSWVFNHKHSTRKSKLVNTRLDITIASREGFVYWLPLWKPFS